MKLCLKAGVLPAVVASLLCLPALSSAELATDAVPPLAAQAPTQTALAALDFLSQAVAQRAESTPDLPAAGVLGAIAAGADERWAAPFGYEQSTAMVAELRGEVDLFLWNLLAIVHAHRDGKPFELAERGVAFVLANHGDQPSAVPLPGALWLFVMGLLGLAGTRLTGGRGAATSKGEHAPSVPMGAAVPA